MKYIIYSTLISFSISMVLGVVLIPSFTRLRLGQYIREEGPKSHKKKSGTPAFGGFIFIIATIITVFINIKNIDNDVRFATYSLTIFAFVGFIDDALKIIHKKNEGLIAYQKMILLLTASCYCAYFMCKNLSLGTSIIIPFKMKLWDLGIFYIPFIIFFYACMTNAVNLTDGLDGLAASVSLLVITFFTIVSFYCGKYSLSLFCGILAGSLLGFLRYNTYPARIIMGDTGSLALGGVIATIAVILKLPLIILLVGGIYVFEITTTLIQIIVFKLTGRRVFKMAPIHHSFELNGWHESKIVTAFSIATTILCIIGFLSLFS